MKEYVAQIVVAGGGPAGVCAAIAAARSGADVLLVEQYGYLGGMSTAGLVAPWMTFHDKEGKQVVFGIAQEIVDRLVETGHSRGHISDTMGETSTITPFDAEQLKYLLAKMCLEASVRLLFHTFIFGAEVNDRKINCLKAANKDGEIRIKADRFVDATGDGDILAMSGCAFEKGRDGDGMMQPASMMFTMANVDFEKVRQYMKEHPDDFHHNTLYERLDEVPNSISGFFSKWNIGREKLGLDIKRDRILFFRGWRNDIAAVNTTRITGIDGTSAEDLTKAEIEGRHQALLVSELLRRYVPGFENAYLLNTASAIGIRETRRLVGRYVLTGKDLESGRVFDDSIALYAYPIDMHQPDGSGFTEYTVPSYGIPYRALLPNEIDNLLVAGRCISATREAQSSLRLTPGCMATGQAAGVAAALGISIGGTLDSIKIEELRAKLIKQHVYLG
jgi:hypothetical protein